MNKKTYFKPAVELINAETEQMLALSLGVWWEEEASEEAMAPTFDIFAEE